MNKILALLLSPFAFLYGLGVSIHQGLYFNGFLKSTSFSIPVISVGNLSVGGTGKSPHIEYLLRFLRQYLFPGVISRGYKRKTDGFRLVTVVDSAELSGDEALQIKRKFPEIPVAVSESRGLGIPLFLAKHPEIQTILMDDGYQHLQVKPGMNILLTEYANPYFKDYLLPSGRLREWRYGSQRADTIIVTKCPHQPDEQEKKAWAKRLKLTEHQALFFSKMTYGDPYSLFNPSRIFKLNDGLHVVLLSAIAQSDYITDFLKDQVSAVTEFPFEDHHFFTEEEIDTVIKKYQSISHFNKLILTTEKDAVRLEKFKEKLEGVEIFILPMKIHFFEEDKFLAYLKNFLLEFKI